MAEKFFELPPRLLREMIEQSTSGIVLTDSYSADNPIIFANRAFYAMTGYSPQETIGYNCRFLQRGDTSQPAVLDLRTAIKKRKSCVVTLRN